MASIGVARLSRGQGPALLDIGMHLVVGLDIDERMTLKQRDVRWWWVEAPFMSKVLYGKTFIANLVRRKLVRYSKDKQGRPILALTRRGYVTGVAYRNRQTSK